jgi:hypothetical protein
MNSGLLRDILNHKVTNKSVDLETMPIYVRAETLVRLILQSRPQ